MPTMAFVVRRPGGRWEIRESLHTKAGPRARSLASFRVLTPDVLERAAQRARTPFAAADIVAAARRSGITIDEAAVDRAARTLLREMARGNLPVPGLRRLLVDRLSPRKFSDPGGGIGDWFGATDEERGDTLRQLLELTDKLPHRRRGKLAFPGLRPARGGTGG
jgi:hypothetical protein